MKLYTIYRREQYDQIVEHSQENILVARRCAICGDDLLGYPELENSPEYQPSCEEGHHGSRPGVHYVGGETIEIEDEAPWDVKV